MDTPYGNYSDFDPKPHWSEFFEPTDNQRTLCQDIMKECFQECADVCRLDTSEWGYEDWSDFAEIMEL